MTKQFLENRGKCWLIYEYVSLYILGAIRGAMGGIRRSREEKERRGILECTR